MVHRLRISNSTVALDVRGSGPAVLFLHGVSANRRSWERVVRRIEGRFTALAPDLPGRGDSEAPAAGGHHLAEEVRRVAEIVLQARIERPLIVGHSHGAAIALALAAAGQAASNPPVAGLVLVNPVTPWTARPSLLSAPGLRRSHVAAHALSRFRKPIARYILERRVLARGFPAGPELIERYAAPYAQPERARALLAILLDWDPVELRSRMPSRRVPALVLAGAQDRRIGMRETARLADAIGAAYVVAAGVGHATPEERPGLVSDAVNEVAGVLELSPYAMPDGGFVQS